MMKFLVSLCLIGLISKCSSYSSGGPVRVCKSMKPGHRTDAQTNRSPPYRVTAENTQLTDSAVKVTIETTDRDTDIKGYMIQARYPDNSIVNGNFVSDVMSQTVTCESSEENTATHRNADPKTSVRLLWKPPTDVKDNVMFVATVVESKSVFWMDVKSDRLEVKAAEPAAREARSNSALGDHMYKGCDKTKLCFGYPNNCAKTKSCLALFKASYDTANTELIMEVYGRVSREHRYFAVGLSDDERMGSDSVTECVQGDDGVRVQNSWNQGKRNRPDDISLITIEEQKFVDGIASCRWRRNATTFTNDRSFDILQNTYHLLLAIGDVDGYTKRKHKVALPSSKSINLTEIEAISGSGLSTLTKAHGCLMVLVWIGCVSLGIITARHCKDVLSDKSIMKNKVWFVVHGGLMATTFFGALTAAVLIFIRVGGWSGPRPHPIVGALTTFFMCLQILSAMLRCHPGTSKRWVFNLLHWLGGNVAHILAVTAIFLSMQYVAMEKQNAYLALLVSFVIVYVTTHIMLEIRTRIQANSSKVMDIQMSASHEMNQKTGPNYGVVNDDKFRLTVVGLFAILNTAFTIGLILIIIST